MSVASTRPPCMSEIRSQRSPSFMKCVETKIVTPSPPREIDEQLPELVARHRIDAGGRLVEDQDLGLVHHRHGQGQTLADAERQRLGQRVGVRVEVEPAEQRGDARARCAAGGSWKRRACSSRFWRTVSSP